MDKQHQQSSGHHDQNETKEKQDAPVDGQDEKVPVQVHDDRAFSFNNGMR